MPKILPKLKNLVKEEPKSELKMWLEKAKKTKKPKNWVSSRTINADRD